MARRRYFRYYPRRTVAKKKWASNLVNGTVSSSGFSLLAQNSTQTTSPTPVIVKCGNFKVQGDVIVTTQSQATNRPVPLVFYILFVPEGVGISDSLVTTHPEWIMGWTVIDASFITSAAATNTGSRFSLTSRLKRNLNSGDSIVAILQSRDSAATAQCAYTCQFWTCAN